MEKLIKKLSDNIDIIILILILGVFFLILESKHPFYFFSDDNRTFYLPMFIHNFRALLNGEFPLFNFHQYLGIPHFSNFQSAVFNPLIYFSIFLSNLVWGHSFWAIDIAVITNIIIGSIGFYFLVRSFTKNRLSALYGAMIWPLSSFGIFVSASWWIFSGVTAYFPWMILFGLRLYRKPNYKNLFLLVISRLFLFYIGHIEYLIYSMIFEFLTVILLTLSFDIKNTFKPFIKKYLSSYFLTFIYALPILLPAWMQTKTSAIRQSKFDFEVIYAFKFTFLTWVKGLINPFAINQDYYQRSASEFSKGALPFLSHIGYIPIILLILILFHNRKKFKDQLFTKVVLFCLFLISIFWAFGLLSGLIYYTPILNRFRWPFKLLAFSNFYLILVSSFSFYFLLKNLKNKMKNLIGSILIAMCLLNFYILYTNVFVSFNNRAHTDSIPIEEPLTEELKNGRIFSLGISVNDPFSVSTLGFNYATMLDLNHFAGYDPLVPMKNFETALDIKYRASFKKLNVPINYLRKWGVKWYILNKDKEQSVLAEHYFNMLSADSCLYVFADEPKRIIFQDKSSTPLIFWEQSQTCENIEFELSTNSIKIKTNNDKAELLVISYLYNDFFTASNNDSILPLTENEIGQMEIFVPEGKNEIVIKYSNSYLNFGIYLVIITTFILVIYLRMRRKRLIQT